MAHYTADEWTEYVRQNFETVGDAERWRNANNVFVDGLPMPTYTGPLSSGRSAGDKAAVELPPIAKQGLKTVEPDEVTFEGALPGGESDAAAVPGNIDPATYFSRINALQAKASSLPAGMTKADYEAARNEIQNRRIGPSRSEQLFALAAAIGKPTLGRSFGEIMGNINPALGDMQKTQREAEQKRADALFALKSQYLMGDRANQLANLEEERKVLALYGPTVAAQMKPKTQRTGFNPITGTLVNMDTGQPVTNASIPTLTPQQVAELSRNPRNRGMKFLTTDGRQMEIK